MQPESLGSFGHLIFHCIDFFFPPSSCAAFKINVVVALVVVQTDVKRSAAPLKMWHLSAFALN